MKVNCSIVLYHTPIAEVQAVVERLRRCSCVDRIWLIDNSELMTERFEFLKCDYIFGQGNVGYGRGHNIAIDKSLNTDADYHLVMNSDICFDESVVDGLLEFMESNRDVAHVMPKVLNPDGTDQRLAKRLPSPWDLLHRRLFGSNRCSLDLADDRVWDVPYLSGCFMFLRMSALRELKDSDGFIFDPRYFLYPEDLDLTRRLNMRHRTVYYPALTITHCHRKESYKSLQMGMIHAWNMLKYFWKWKGNWR